MSAADNKAHNVPRYGAASRIAHWLVAVAYVLLFASGLALFHPYFYWLSLLYGGGPFMRLLHPFLGVALFVLFFAYAARIWHENVLLKSDWNWLARAFDVMFKKEEVEVEGKYNAGQKLMFWSMVLVIAGLMFTGVFIWRPYFAHLFSADVRRLANVTHAAFGFIMFVGIGVHVYAAIWTKGSITGMIRGHVPRAWARFHHPGWYKEITAADGKRKKVA